MINEKVIIVNIEKEIICFLVSNISPAIRAKDAITGGNCSGKKFHIKNIITIPPMPEPIIFAKYKVPILSTYFTNTNPMLNAANKKGSIKTK